MKKLLLILAGAVILASTNAQVVSTDPPYPSTNQSVVVTFDASQGNGGLAGYTGDVYAHTGVITEFSSSGSDWKYVKAGWGENIPECKLTRIGDDLYTLNIIPDIRQYYDVPADEEILQMAFVFRSGELVGGAYLEGKGVNNTDIFVEVAESGLSISIASPDETPIILEGGENIPVVVNASESDSIILFQDGERISSIAGVQLSYTITPPDDQAHWVKAIAKNSDAMVADSFYYMTRPEVPVAELPSGIRDGINYTGDETAVLCIFAPGKENIFVLGDFNDWLPLQEHYMNKTPDGERFWVEINNLTPGEEYVFQYLIDKDIRVGDPYADKTSDPWNDKYITESTYPGLIDYPEGKAVGVATVLQTAQEDYQWEISNFAAPPVTDLVVYEMLIRDFTTAHTYASIADTLDYLAGLGVNVLELMPVNEFEGNSSWGYNPSFYFAPDKYYGPKNELKRLVDECHKRDIAVVMDMVLNHSYGQSPLVQMYFDGNKPSADNPWYNEEHNFANTAAHWGYDFNHESPYTEAFVDSVLAYWMNEYKIDGYRLDFTKGFSNTWHPMSDEWGSNYDQARIDNLKRIAERAWEVNEDAILILEHLAENLEEKVLANFGFLMWGNMNHEYMEAGMGYQSDLSGISYKTRTWTYPHLLGYMESHDEERVMYKNVTWGNSGPGYNVQDTSTALDRVRLNACFFFTVPGPKMIWQFGELGYDYSIDYNGRLGEKPVRWDYFSDWRRNYNYKFYGSLIKLRNSYDVFRTSDFEMNVDDPLKSIKLYADEMNVVIVGNFDVVIGSIAPQFPHTGMWYEYFSGDSIDVVDVGMDIELQAGEYRIYTDVQLESPEIGTGIEPLGEGSSSYMGVVYPNPSSADAKLRIYIEEPCKLSLGVYNVLGNELIRTEERSYMAGIHDIDVQTSVLNPGMYFFVFGQKGNKDTIKFIKQ